MNERSRANVTAISALLASAAILMGYVESLIPVVPPVAGIKLGISNIVLLLALRLLPSPKYAVGIMLTKVFVCALLFGGIGSLPYSFAGGVFSLAVMALCVRCKKLSSAGISALGGAVHITAQLCVAAAITSVGELMTLLPILLAVGTLTGFINGMAANMTEDRVRKFLRVKNSGYAD